MWFRSLDDRRWKYVDGLVRPVGAMERVFAASACRWTERFLSIHAMMIVTSTGQAKMMVFEVAKPEEGP